VLIKQCYTEIKEEGTDVKMPDIGVMIEVPAAVYQAEDILQRVDFLSVGSNDLVQYMLAVDRNNSRVASLYQELHPAVLKALDYVAKTAVKAKKGFGICGEMAGNPIAALLLMAMGYPVLSMNSPNLMIVKKVLTTVSYEQSQLLLEEVLQMDSATQVRQRAEEVLRENGLSQIIRSRG